MKHRLRVGDRIRFQMEITATIAEVESDGKIVADMPYFGRAHLLNASEMKTVQMVDRREDLE